MAIQDIKTYTYKDIFSLQTVQFEKACVVNKPEQVNTYKIFWIKDFRIPVPFKKTIFFFYGTGTKFYNKIIYV